MTAKTSQSHGEPILGPETLRTLFDEIDEKRGFLASRMRSRAYAHADAWEAETRDVIDARHEQFLGDEQAMCCFKDEIAALRKRLEEAERLILLAESAIVRASTVLGPHRDDHPSYAGAIDECDAAILALGVVVCGGVVALAPDAPKDAG